MNGHDLILQFLASAIASGGFAVIFKIPPPSLLVAALTGAAGWMAYLLVLSNSGTIMATFIASAMVSFVAEVSSRRLKTPATTIAVPGIIPLVPGMRVYRSMEYFLNGDNLNGIDEAAITLLISGAIAFGLAIVSSVYRLRKKH
ncbi:MAG: threonine/serine exporter family protein [Firmicutes bacterium]|nr:threonine/serine exporter family protein [Bacillota bacterium]